MSFSDFAVGSWESHVAATGYDSPSDQPFDMSNIPNQAVALKSYHPAPTSLPYRPVSYSSDWNANYQPQTSVPDGGNSVSGYGGTFTSNEQPGEISWEIQAQAHLDLAREDQDRLDRQREQAQQDRQNRVSQALQEWDKMTPTARQDWRKKQPQGTTQETQEDQKAREARETQRGKRARQALCAWAAARQTPERSGVGSQSVPSLSWMPPNSQTMEDSQNSLGLGAQYGSVDVLSVSIPNSFVPAPTDWDSLKSLAGGYQGVYRDPQAPSAPHPPWQGSMTSDSNGFVDPSLGDYGNSFNAGPNSMNGAW